VVALVAEPAGLAPDDLALYALIFSKLVLPMLHGCCDYLNLGGGEAMPNRAQCIDDLYKAVQQCDFDRVKSMLSDDSTLINAARPGFGGTMLHEVLRLGVTSSEQKQEIIKFGQHLIKNGLDVTIKDNLGQTPVQFARMMGKAFLTIYDNISGTQIGSEAPVARNFLGGVPPRQALVRPVKCSDHPDGVGERYSDAVVPTL